MTKTKLNILPVPTFSRLGVNFAERETDTLGKENISVPENTEQHIIQFADTDCETTVTVGKGARLKLVQVFTGKRVSVLKTAVGDNAELGLIQLYLGGDIVSEIITELQGYKAVFNADIGYDLGYGDVLDLNLAANHYGRKSTCAVNVNGVLRANAQKTFKGTIDFKKGASGAKGSEKEEVILLDESVVNKTVPVILCAEEDVEGSHGATIGRIDESHIFYMRSRGIPEEKIYEMITRSKLARLIAKIGDEQTQKRLSEMLGWGDEVE